MFKSDSKNIERVKDVLIVVLFTITVLLLCFFWKNDSFEGFKMPIDIVSSETEYMVPEIDDIVQPENIIVGFGTTGSYTVLSHKENQLWKQALEEFIQIGKSENLLVEEITAEQYKQIIELRSIQFQFPYDIPFSDFLLVNGIKKSQALDSISGMGTLAYSEGSKESLFIYENKKDKYYRIISNQKSFNGFTSMIDQVEALPYVTYYPSSNYFGVETEKVALIPLSLQSNLIQIPFDIEASIENKQKVSELAESFFGESFDFIRRMTDNKNRIIYMYGYGQKVFTVNTNGTFEYKEEPDDSSTVPLDFYESLKTALYFVSTHGTWESLNGAKLTPYLKDVQSIEKDKKKGYRFTFGMMINGYEVQYESGEAIEIELCGSQVLSYRRNMLNLDMSVVSSMESTPYTEAFPAVNVAAVNYEYINELYGQTNKNNDVVGEAKIDNFEYLAAEIREIKVGYLRSKGEEERTTVVPVWILKLDGLEVYFDLFTAQPMGHKNR